MFTGLIEEIGYIRRIDKAAGKILILAKAVTKNIAVGDSIAVNGACLTVVDFSPTGFTADVMPETFRRTALAALKDGDAVNLERAMPADGRFGGHIVSGHIDGVGEIKTVKTEANAVILTIYPPIGLLPYIAEKGSISIDGVSLTIVKAVDEYFTVSLIPHTRHMTTLFARQKGDKVNIETDLIAKYTAQFLHFFPKIKATVEKSSSLSTAFLSENGFI